MLTQITKKLPLTLELAGISGGVMILIAFPLGILTEVKKNKAVDYIVRLISFLGISMPNFWLGMLLIYFRGFCTVRAIHSP